MDMLMIGGENEDVGEQHMSPSLSIGMDGAAGRFVLVVVMPLLLTSATAFSLLELNKIPGDEGDDKHVVLIVRLDPTSGPRSRGSDMVIRSND
jgi:hypothetical protein